MPPLGTRERNFSMAAWLLKRWWRQLWVWTAPDRLRGRSRGKCRCLKNPFVTSVSSATCSLLCGDSTLANETPRVGLSRSGQNLLYKIHSISFAVHKTFLSRAESPFWEWHQHFCVIFQIFVPSCCWNFTNPGTDVTTRVMKSSAALSFTMTRLIIMEITPHKYFLFMNYEEPGQSFLSLSRTVQFYEKDWSSLTLNLPAGSNPARYDFKYWTKYFKVIIKLNLINRLSHSRMLSNELNKLFKPTSATDLSSVWETNLQTTRN